MTHFAYRGIYHIDRSDPTYEVCEELHGHMLYEDPAWHNCDDSNMQYELEHSAPAQIDALPDGIHVVWVTGRMEGVSYDTDCGTEYDVNTYIDIEHWSPAGLDDLEFLRDEDPGLDQDWLATLIEAAKQPQPGWV